MKIALYHLPIISQGSEAKKSKEERKGEKKETEKKGRPGQDFRKQVRRQEDNVKAKRWLPGLSAREAPSPRPERQINGSLGSHPRQISQ